MRKFIFSAFAVVAFAGSSFASNEVLCNQQFDQVESEDRPCTIFITIYNRDGTAGTLKKEGGTMSLGNCGKYQDACILELRDGGIHVDEENDVKLVWG